ncbi:MAG: dephospho-CoA kinase [Immundisolibacteraceae bacterium]|nr:dephospho-CoA kinase [Immundisolibacteraceae bacterium]
MPFIIGLTGGIACGKTTASDFFNEHGIEIVDADIVSREVVQPGEPALQEIVELFGPSILDGDGQLDRQQMRTLVFEDPAKRKQLEDILHPVIRSRLDRLLKNSQGPYVIFSVPLLIESGLQSRADRVLVIDVDPKTQLSRLTSRDGISHQQAQAMVDSQLPREQRNLAADDIIDNSTSVERFLDQLEKRHKEYLTLAQQA